jgi:hypothetical protein
VPFFQTYPPEWIGYDFTAPQGALVKTVLSVAGGSLGKMEAMSFLKKWAVRAG